MGTAAFADAVDERQRGDGVSELASSPMSRAVFADAVDERQRGDCGSVLAGSALSTPLRAASPSPLGEEDA
jgi:hypothetical protein